MKIFIPTTLIHPTDVGRDRCRNDAIRAAVCHVVSDLRRSAFARAAAARATGWRSGRSTVGHRDALGPRRTHRRAAYWAPSQPDRLEHAAVAAYEPGSWILLIAGLPGRRRRARAPAFVAAPGSAVQSSSVGGGARRSRW